MGKLTGVSNLVQSKAFRAFPLVLLVIAAVADVWAMVVSIGAMSESVVAGVVGLFLALLLAGAIAWRIRVKWDQLHSD
jgi:hypothetical protein